MKAYVAQHFTQGKHQLYIIGSHVLQLNPLTAFKHRPAIMLCCDLRASHHLRSKRHHSFILLTNLAAGGSDATAPWCAEGGRRGGGRAGRRRGGRHSDTFIRRRQRRSEERSLASHLVGHPCLFLASPFSLSLQGAVANCFFRKINNLLQMSLCPPFWLPFSPGQAPSSAAVRHSDIQLLLRRLRGRSSSSLRCTN